MAVTKEEIDNWFSYHPPTGSQTRRYEIIQNAAKQLALSIVVCTPACADQTAAIRKVREAVMTANAAIACEEPTTTKEATHGKERTAEKVPEPR